MASEYDASTSRLEIRAHTGYFVQLSWLVLNFGFNREGPDTLFGIVGI